MMAFSSEDLKELWSFGDRVYKMSKKIDSEPETGESD